MKRGLVNKGKEKNNVCGKLNCLSFVIVLTQSIFYYCVDLVNVYVFDRVHKERDHHPVPPAVCVPPLLFHCLRCRVLCQIYPHLTRSEDP